MSNELWKDLEAYDVVFNHFNNCTCQDDKFPVRSALDHIYKVLKRNEPMKPNYGGKFPQCPACKKLLHSIWQKHCDSCTQAIDWSD